MSRLCLLLITLLLVPGMTRAATLDVRPDEAAQTVLEVESFGAQNGTDAEVLTRLQAQRGTGIDSGAKVADALSTVWMRVDLRNESAEELQRVIYLMSNFAARSFDFYFYRDGNLLEHRIYRSDRVIASEDVIGRSSYASFAIAPHSTLSIYMKVETGPEAFFQNFQLAQRQTFIDFEVVSTFFVGLYLGILFLTMIAHLIQAAAYRDKAFLYYAAYCGCLFTMCLSLFGVWVRLFGMYETQRYGAYIFSNLFLIAGTAFVRSVLDTDTVAPRLNLVLRMVPWLAGITIILRCIPSTTNFGLALYNLNSILFNILACLVGVMAIVRGRELAWLYTSSFIAFAGSIIYLRLASLNIMTINPWAFYAPPAGQILQILLLSYVMFVRGRSCYREMLTSQRSRSMNEKLNLLLKIISHDIANPLQAISLYCNMALDKARAEKVPQKELERAMEAIDTQARIIRHAKEAVRQMQIGQKVQIQPIAVSQILGEVLQVFQPLCQDRGINLEVTNELKEDLVIHTDPTILVHSIFGNILSNSIKFSPQGGTIAIRVHCVHRRLIFDLVDNGPGISKDKRVEIFTLNLGRSFNDQITGAGSFGLSILHMCSELLQGHLDIGPSEISESGQEMGLRISVSLPLHHAL